MKSLDLTKTPPRSPREELGGLVMLARTIDKARALLPGGNPGPYHMKGFSSKLFEALDIEEAAFRQAVADGENDADVVVWFRAHSDPAKYGAINAQMLALRIADRLDRPDFVEKYPIVHKLPPETTLFEMLEYDDCDSFLQ